VKQPDASDQSRTQKPQLQKFRDHVTMNEIIQRNAEGHQHEDKGAGKLTGVDPHLTLVGQKSFSN
jgi:hypothetical protein